MAILKTYPLKNNYYGSDRIVLSDMQPDNLGVVHGTTKSLTLSSLKSFIGSGNLNLTTTGTSGASTFNSNTNVLNIPIYSSTDTNTTYSLGTGSTPGIIALTGSDGTIDNVTIQGAGGISINQYTAGVFQVDGSGISGGVAQVTAASPAASIGDPLVISPTTGNVTVQSRAYDGGSNLGHVPTGGTANTFLRGDGNFATVVTSTPAFSPLPMYMAGTSIAIGTSQTYLTQWYSTVKMSPTKIKLFFPTANGEDISIALYNGTINPKDGQLYASKVNHSVGSTSGIQEITLTQESGVSDIVVGQAIALVISIKGRGGNDTLLTAQGFLDDKIGQVSTTENYIASAFPANISSFTTGFVTTKVRPAFFLY
tara:strand:+ start:1028 stop:2131 length:1104 start_codon:yes stop_codon:yes gene_type:complete